MGVEAQGKKGVKDGGSLEACVVVCSLGAAAKEVQVMWWRLEWQVALDGGRWHCVVGAQNKEKEEGETKMKRDKGTQWCGKNEEKC
jgi:hypothetical protein